MKKWMLFTMVLLSMGLLASPASAMLRVAPPDQRLDLVQVKMKEATRISVVLENMQFDWPSDNAYVSSSLWESVKRRHTWVHRPLANFLVENGYATLVETAKSQ